MALLNSLEEPTAYHNRISTRSDSMNRNAKHCVPFTDEEISSLLKSFKMLEYGYNSNSTRTNSNDKIIDYDKLDKFFRRVAHISYKENFNQTKSFSHELRDIIGDTSYDNFHYMFHRILHDGNYYEAINHSKSSPQHQWAVLVTGLNGIRKTTSLHTSYFQDILLEALSLSIPKESLPYGRNSFYRQLDYIIATIANHEFVSLYEIQLSNVSLYLKYKNAIFTRYRNIAEILGMILVEDAVSRSLNVLVESSGRDMASFGYMDHCFEDGIGYKKLLIHFRINDIRFAEESVENRMMTEMRNGMAVASASEDEGASARDIIRVNAGGPYSSEQLKDVLNDSDRVVGTVLRGEGSLGQGWYKAVIDIQAYNDEPWRIKAHCPGSREYTF